MTTKRCLVIGLTLVGALAVGGAALAEKQSGGPAGQGSQLCTGGPGGTCAVTPAPGSGNQNCPGSGAGKSQNGKGMKGSRGGAQPGQANPQATPPASTSE